MSDGASDAPVQVAKAGDLFEARLIVGRLEAAGIHAVIPGESMLETYDGVAAIWSEGVPVEVAAHLADEALRILED